MVTIDVPPQLSSQDEQDQLEGAATRVTEAMQSQFLLSMALQFALKGAISMLWTIFNTLQLILALPLLSIQAPSNVIFMVAAVTNIINFQPIKPQQIYDWVMPRLFGTSSSTAKLTDQVSGEEAEEGDSLQAYFRGTNFIMHLLIPAGLILLLALLILLVVLCRRKLIGRCKCL